MEKLSLTCQCGQEMVVPATALGRSGLCPGCGAQVSIASSNTQPYRPRRRPVQQRAVAVRTPEPARENTGREEAWRSFAAAVDLYNTRRYAEALTLLDTLLRQFPGNEHVAAARSQCLEALQRVTLSAHTYDGQPVDDAVLSPELVKSVVLDKLLRGGNEDVQLRAAELAARMLGMLETASGAGVEPQTEADPPPAAAALTVADLTAATPANGHARTNGHAYVDLNHVSVHWRSEPRRFSRSMERTEKGYGLSSHDARLEEAIVEKAAEIVLTSPPSDEVASSPEFLLPDPVWRNRQRSRRFPKKIIFE